jgi:hypothetical protein
MTWQDLQNNVKTIATFKWDQKAESEIINGVSLDLVIKHKIDYWIIIEVTKENTLAKLRTDLAKYQTVRPFLFSKLIYIECYFICENTPPPSLVLTGKGLNVNVLSFKDFEKLFFDYDSYRYARISRKFGSAVDPISGDKDTKKYIPVKYQGISISSLIRELWNW